ncbi:pyridoxamine 5'-phosphate oxidase family protein [Janibacter sp. GXQ6167]|uniref:pyridoxamine 5'-phosphate oxidase family protein n=1 Tax=Janibacter sp. GXQ6167 TaxID=3240791 RepID=UPI003524F89A
MTDSDVVVRDLTVDECWDLLRQNSFGRLAYHLRGRTTIAPVNYAIDGDRIVFRTAEGSKFYALKVEDIVAFEIDEHDGRTASSVVTQGKVTEVVDDDERAEVTMNLRPWVRTEKKHVLVLDVLEISGRSFVLDPAATGADRA